MSNSFLISSIGVVWWRFLSITRNALSCFSWYVWKSALESCKYLITERYESAEVVESLTPFVELLHEKCSPLVNFLMELQKVLKLLTMRMNIGGGGLITGVVVSGSKSISVDWLSFCFSEGSMSFENSENRFDETNVLLCCEGELGE